MTNPRGKFIVIEGIDGSGKSTQLSLLIRELHSRRIKTKYIHFPQHSTRSAAMVDDYLNGKYGKISSHVASLFFAVDRFDGSYKIRDWLARGYTVLCDRWVTSNAAHQGQNFETTAQRRKYYVWLKNLEYGSCNLPRPDLTIILNMPGEIASRLIRHKNSNHRDRRYIKGKRDLLERDRKHLVKSQITYLALPKYFAKTCVIDCAQDGEPLPINTISEIIWEKIKRFY